MLDLRIHPSYMVSSTPKVLLIFLILVMIFAFSSFYFNKSLTTMNLSIQYKNFIKLRVQLHNNSTNNSQNHNIENNYNIDNDIDNYNFF